jgi:hypothetical protein
MTKKKHAARGRKFQRKYLKDELEEGIYDQIVIETQKLLERRFRKLAQEFNNIQDTNFNPFLLLITAPVYNLFSPFEIAERLQLAKAFHGDDTAFGRFGEEKLLPLFGAISCAEKKEEGAAWEPIDREITIEGTRYLLSLKSGPWTMNQGHANAMSEKFKAIHDQTGCPIIVGIMYGRYKNLNNKPQLVETNLGNPDWFDFLVGRDFWEFVSGVQNVHKIIYDAIRTAQKLFADKHKDETFQEKLVGNRLKIAASLRKEFDVAEDEDFWSTLFNNMF